MNRIEVKWLKVFSPSFAHAHFEMMIPFDFIGQGHGRYWVQVGTLLMVLPFIVLIGYTANVIHYQ